jgi:1,4-dihydroxy-6-naphthoate synthase
MELTLGISPCPNDTFIFGPIINGWIDTQGLRFKTEYHDVQELNIAAKEARFDVCKISFANYPAISSNYQILNAGAALGRGCGPLLVRAEKPFREEEEEEEEFKVAIPGINTTANALLSMAFPRLHRKKEVLFSDIERRVLEGEFDLGLLIHESGLNLVKDLGSWWEEKTGEAIPLGGIAIKRNQNSDTARTVHLLIRESIRYSYAHPEKIMPYVAVHAAELDPDVMKSHIDLYVNSYSMELGKGGIFAIETFFSLGALAGLFGTVQDDWLFTP